MMKQLVVAAFALVALVGCTENKLTVINEADYTVHFNFQGKQHELVGLRDGTTGESVSIEIADAPNGTYPYSTVYTYPAIAEVVMGEGLSGELTFERSATEMLLIYGSSTSQDSSGQTYTIFASVTSSDPVSFVHP